MLESRIMGFSFGWKMGFEPTTNGTTNHYSNRLSYIHRISGVNIGLFFEIGKEWIKKINFAYCGLPEIESSDFSFRHLFLSLPGLWFNRTIIVLRCLSFAE